MFRRYHLVFGPVQYGISNRENFNLVISEKHSVIGWETRKTLRKGHHFYFSWLYRGIHISIFFNVIYKYLETTFTLRLSQLHYFIWELLSIVDLLIILFHRLEPNSIMTNCNGSRETEQPFSNIRPNEIYITEHPFSLSHKVQFLN